MQAEFSVVTNIVNGVYRCDSENRVGYSGQSLMALNKKVIIVGGALCCCSESSI